MKRGPKPTLPSEKIVRGTWRNDRDGGVAEIIEPAALPLQPDWLTPEGEVIWQDDIGRVAAGRLVSERDSTLFATYCNLAGANGLAWRAGEVPPAAHITALRQLAELFGLAGAKSRLVSGEAPKSANPFARNGKRG